MPPVVAASLLDTPAIANNSSDAAAEPSPALLAEIDELVKKVTSQGSLKSLREEIDALAAFGIQIGQNFRNVAEQLGAVMTDGGVSFGMKLKLLTFAAGGLKYCKQFLQLVFLSGDVANDALKICNEFVETILPTLSNKTKTLDEKKKMASSFETSLEDNDKRAVQLSQGFTDLEREFVMYVNKFTNEVNSFNVEEAEKEITRLDGVIKQLSENLEMLKQKIVELHSALAQSQKEVTVTSILGLLCPVWFIGTFAATRQSSQQEEELRKVVEERDKTVKELQQNQDQRSHLQTQIYSVSKMRAMLKGIVPDLDSFASKITAFAHVWACIRAEVGTLRERLDIANEGDTDRWFDTRTKLSTAMYIALGQLLSSYKEYFDKCQALKQQLQGLGFI